MSDHIAVQLSDKAIQKGTWDHSTFPHPLITCDYDSDGNLINVEILGPLAEAITNLITVAVAYSFERRTQK